MSKEFLWAGPSCDLSYVGNDGNIAATTGERGSLSAWVNTHWPGSICANVTPAKYYSRLLYAGLDADNWLTVYAWRYSSADRRLVFEVCGNGTTKRVIYQIDTGWPADTWRHVAATWDFSGGAGAGVLRLYVDGAEVGTAITDANPLTAQPLTIKVGNASPDTYTLTGWKGFVDDLAVWNGLMTAPQVAALYAAGRRHPLIEGDGTGTLLFHLPFDGSFDAAVSAGTATATYTTETALIPDGATERGLRSELHFGTGTDRARIGGLSVLGKPTSGIYTTPVDAAGYTEYQTAATTAHLELRDLYWRRLPVTVRIRLTLDGLATGEYILLGPHLGAVRLYSDRMVDDQNTNNVLALPISGANTSGWNDGYGGGSKWVEIWLHYTSYNDPVTGAGWMAINYDRGGPIARFQGSWTNAANVWRVQAAEETMPTSTMTLRIESITFYGPTDYQENDSAFDNFLGAWTGSAWTGKVWRADNVERALVTPTLHAGNPILTEAFLAGWNECQNAFAQTRATVEAHEGGLRMWWAGRMSSQPATDCNLRLFTSPDGITWTADPANPVLDLQTLLGAVGDHDEGWNFGVLDTSPLLRDPEGRAALAYVIFADYDGGALYLLLGGTDDDEYTLTAADKLGCVVTPYGQLEDSGQNWHNRDLRGIVIENPWPKDDGSDRYLMLGNAKTKWTSYPYALETRHPITLKSRDLRVWRPVVDGASIPLPSHALGESGRPLQIAKDSFLYLSYGGYSTGLWLLHSEDGRWFEDAVRAAIPPGTQAWDTGLDYKAYRATGMARLGDELAIIYQVNIDATHGGMGLATARWNGLAYISLSAGETSGWFESCAFTEPDDGWGPFYLNADCQDGSITVALLDPDTREELPGYGAADMDSWTGDNVDQEVTWGGHGANELTESEVAVKIAISRDAAGDSSPRVYSYELSAATVYYPTASALEVEAASEPISVTPPNPTFSWTFADAGGGTQSHARFVLTANVDDIAKFIAEDDSVVPLYDTGWVVHTADSFVYGTTAGFDAGPDLTGFEVYGWTVLVKSTTGQEQQIATAEASVFATRAVPGSDATTLLAAQSAIVDAMLDYADWRTGGTPPCELTIADRKEGHPRVFFGKDVSYPLVCVKVASIPVNAPAGKQQQINVEAKAWYIMEMGEDTYINDVIRERTGQLVENLLQSNRLNLPWVSDFTLTSIEFENSDIETYFRRNALKYLAGEATFRVTLWYER